MESREKEEEDEGIFGVKCHLKQSENKLWRQRVILEVHRQFVHRTAGEETCSQARLSLSWMEASCDASDAAAGHRQV